MKIIGLMCTWNNLEFLKCSLPQALSFCDELIVVEGCHSQQYPKHSTDGTCEYIETIKNLPKLVIRDFDFSGRYDKVQRRIRQDFPKESVFYKLDNWIIPWDDDYIFMEEELPILRAAIETTESDSLKYAVRQFIYNFRFNSIWRNPILVYKISNKLHLKGINTPCYKNGRVLSSQFIEGVTLFHYNYIKKPKRMEARFVMSIEKGTKESVGRYENFMAVKWDKDEDIFKSRAIVESVRPGEGLHIYKGEHPKAVANHPWRYIKDIREIK